VADYLQRVENGAAEPLDQFLASSGFAREVVQDLIGELTAEAPSSVPRPPAPRPSSFAGETFGRFELRAVLGQGGMGTVYVAYDPHLGREVALKRIRRDLTGSAEVRPRFYRELKAVSRLNHPNICQVFEAGEVDGEPFFVMPRIAGQSLAAKIGAVKSASHGNSGSATAGVGADTQAAVVLVEKVARALAHAHDNGLIHRDVKPSNILVTDEGEPMLVDFGLARDEAASHSHTRSGFMVGTCAYMSPEQLRLEGRTLDARTDVFSLGVVMWELLTGTHPFAGKNESETIPNILAAPPRSTPAARRLPADVRAILGKALAKDRDKRYASAALLADDLARARRLEPIEALSSRPWPQLRLFFRRRACRLAAGVGLGIVLASAGWFALGAARSARLQNAFVALHAASGHPTEQLAAAVALVKSDRAVTAAALSAVWQALDRCGQAWALSRTASGRGQVIADPALDPQGATMACVTDAGEVMVFDVATGALRKQWQGHQGACHAAVFDPSGNRLFTCGEDGAVKSWGGPDWHEQYSVPLRQDPVTSAQALAVSAQAGLLAIGGDHGVVKLRRLHAGTDTVLELGHDKTVCGVEFAPAGDRLAALTELRGMFGRLRQIDGFTVWQVHSPHARWDHIDAARNICHFAWHPDGTRIATTTEDGRVQVFRLEPGQAAPTLTFDESFSPGDWPVRWAQFNPQGELLVGADAGLVVLRFNDRGAAATHVVPSVQQRPIAQGAYSPDGQQFAAMLRDGALCFFDPATWSLRETMLAPAIATARLSLCWAQRAQRIVTSSNTLVCGWFVGDRPILPTYRRHVGNVASVDVSADGRWLLTGGADGLVRVWQRDGAVLTHTLTHRDPVREARFGPDGAWFFVTAGARVFVHRVTQGSFAPVVDRPGTAAFVCDRALLLVANGREATLLDLDTMQTQTSAEHSAAVLTAVYDRATGQVFTGGADRRVARWRAADPRAGGSRTFYLDVMKGSPVGRVTALAHDPHAQTLWVGHVNNLLCVVGCGAEDLFWEVRATVNADISGGPIAMDAQGRYVVMTDLAFGRVTWFDANTFRVLKTTRPRDALLDVESMGAVHQQTVTAVRFSPDGRYALTAAKDGIVHLWDPTTQAIVGTIRNEGAVPFLDACFTPDGKWIVTGDGSGVVREWPVDPVPVAEEYLRQHRRPH
jgi:WD40 repeat protein